MDNQVNNSEVKLKMLYALSGKTPDDMNCLSVEAAIGLYVAEHNLSYSKLLEEFICSCSVEEFQELKMLVLVDKCYDKTWKI